MLFRSGDATHADYVEIVKKLLERFSHDQGELEISKVNSENLQSLLVSAPVLTGLLQAHLSQTTRTTESAAIKIMHLLTTVSTKLEKLIESLDETKTRAAELYRQSTDRLAASNLLMESLNDYQRQLDRQIADAIDSVIKKVKEMKPETELIRDVTEKTNILAINAAIEAARAGQSGVGFAVVAQEIRKLFTQVDSAAQRIEGSVKQVSQTVNDKLNAIITKIGCGDEEECLSTLAAELPKLSGDFHATVEEFNNFAVKTHQTTHDIRQNIIDLLTESQFQDITRQQIEHVQNGLDMFGNHLNGIARMMVEAKGPLEIPALDNLTEELRKKYTMQLQKKTHQIVLGTKDSSDDTAPLIELF